MSTHYQLIAVFPPQEISKKEVISYFHEKGILDSIPSNCLLASEKEGFRAGEFAKLLVEDEESIPTSGVCGVEFSDERQVATAGGNMELEEILCPVCEANQLEHGLDLGDFFERVGSWNEGENIAMTCASCKHESPMDSFSVNKGFCLTNFVITFWNWPSIKPSFIEELHVKFGLGFKHFSGMV